MKARSRVYTLLAAALLFAAVLLTVAPFQPAAQADDWFFCHNARYEHQICLDNYQACGGLFVPGCWETYTQCREASGIDQCE